MEIRAVHFDMKAMIPKPDYALTLVDEIADEGINALLVEFEDKFPFDITAGIHHPCAWTKEEFRRFAEKCKARNVELIPLLQSVGHLDYLLKYPKFRDLRDGGPEGSSYQWCLADEGSFELWRAMADELIAAFPDTKIFHIGADECRMNVPCGRCAEKRLELYVERVARCCRYIQEKGLKVLLWDDVFRKYGEEKFSLLPKGVIPCVWMYGTLDPEYIGRMAASGLEFWGSSSIQGDRFYHAMGPQEPRMDNVDAWGEMNERYPQITGHIGTIWGRNQCQSPYKCNLPQSLFMVSYLAETLNRGVIGDREKFIRAFGERFFGMELDYPTLIKSFCLNPGYAEPIVTELREKAPRHRDIAEIWYGLNAVDQMLFFLYSSFANNESLLSTYRAGMAPREMTTAWLENVRKCRENTGQGLAELHPLMTKYFPEAVWEEFTDQRFRARLELNEYWRHVISAAALKWDGNLKRL